MLPCCRWMYPVAGAGILLAGVVVLPGGWWMCPPWLVPVSFRLVLLSFLVAGGCVPVAGGCVPVAGGASWHPRPHIHSRAPWWVRTSLLSAAGTCRRNPSFKGIKMKGYCSIYQLFKISSWVALYKSFMDRNLTKTLFSIDYRGYFIIQATHSTINYSHFLHKTDIKYVKNQ